MFVFLALLVSLCNIVLFFANILLFTSDSFGLIVTYFFFHKYASLPFINLSISIPAAAIGKSPTAVKTDAKFQYVATAGATVAIDTDGNRYCWGAPCTTMGYGANQIDDAFDPSAAITPFSLKKIKNDTAPKGTYYFGNGTTYIIDANNTLYISGGRGSRLDPFETNGSIKTFTKVADKVAMLTKSNYGTLYIDTDGNIWGWGSSAFKLCPETTKPVQITNGIKFIDVAILSSGSTMAYALAADGSIYTFGEKNSTPTVLEVK